MIKLPVPHYSQFEDVIDPTWQPKVCAITCLKMVLDYISQGGFDPSLDYLIQEGESISGYIPNIGWSHDAIVRLAHNHNFPAYNEEFRSIEVNISDKTFKPSKFIDELTNYGIEKIKTELTNKKPVIISCSKNFQEINKPHQVVLVGFDENSFLYHDPDTNTDSTKSGENREVSFEDFKTHWRKFAIFF